jgi:hypothetical protein
MGRISGAIKDLLDEGQQHVGWLWLLGEAHQHEASRVGLQRFVGRLRQVPYQQVKHLAGQCLYLALVATPWINEGPGVDSTATKHAVPPRFAEKSTTIARIQRHICNVNLV